MNNGISNLFSGGSHSDSVGLVSYVNVRSQTNHPIQNIKRSNEMRKILAGLASDRPPKRATTQVEEEISAATAQMTELFGLPSKCSSVPKRSIGRYYVGSNHVRCTETEGELNLYAKNMEISCVKTTNAAPKPESSHAFRLTGSRGQPSGSMSINLISTSRKSRELPAGKIPCGLKGAEREEAKKLQAEKRKELLCALEPDVRVKAKNIGGLFPQYEATVYGQKRQCEFTSRFGEAERKIINRAKYVRGYDMDVSYAGRRTDSEPLVQVKGHQYNPNV
ncbi:hypothetical protein [Paraburkholderia humisilvae]|uniref:Uncharacterized protein n=1 Tax=Paraburkholderia humisilvae TaxID=627669 RepID=A0A6J5F389_9BURK|nr:hypothetical protein [Paraburkholderia humisilvae]CAB3773300.1 hypothetical protein LMG29542_07180 [Paraburkholderia humisilvae]